MSYRVESHCNTSQISLGGWGADGGCKQISKVKQTSDFKCTRSCSVKHPAWFLGHLGNFVGVERVLKIEKCKE